jgi:ubiquinone/menaquinone biosynthesis C-methylase UbiE
MHHDHHHHHDRLFPAEAAARLDDPSRLERQPPEAIVNALSLSAGARVLDFGAGTGYYAVPIAQRLRTLGSGGKVYAVDTQSVMHVHLEAKLPGLDVAPIEKLTGSVEALQGMEQGSVDRALMANVVHEVPDRQALFEAVARVLVPGGMALIVDWHPDGSTDHGPPRDHRVPPDEVCRYLSHAGFGDLEALPCYPDHYVLRAIRK